MHGKLYTSKKYSPVTIKKLRKKLDGCERDTLPPLDPNAQGTLLEPSPLPGKLYWAKTNDSKLYGLFCTDLRVTSDKRQIVDAVLGIWEGSHEENDRAVLESIARNWITESESEELGKQERAFERGN